MAKDLYRIEKNLNRPRQPLDYAHDDEWSDDQELRAKRRDLIPVLVGIACLLVAIVGGLWGLNLWLGG